MKKAKSAVTAPRLQDTVRAMPRHARAASAVMLLSLLWSTGARGQHPMPRSKSDTAAPSPMPPDTGSLHGMGEMTDPIGVPMTRTGSGTTWLPDRTPMRAKHIMAGQWELMIHGLAFVEYDKQYTIRGDAQFGAPNWGMLMASHPLGEGRLQLRGMLSLDPFTLTSRGYPLLLQSGESFQGLPLHDRQHPHDLFMELAAIYEYPLAHDLGLQLYVAPVGEPASGPVAFPHRPSASSDPFAPLGHHWEDATHISFGVMTAGLYTRTVKLEGSIFNGREPDEIRTNFDYKGRSLDSYTGRLTVNPNPNWSLEGSYAYLKSPEQLRPELSQHRVTASALYGRTFRANGEWSSAIIYGANLESGEQSFANAALAETSLDFDRLNTVFARAEFVQKSAADLAVDGSIPPNLGGTPALATSDTRFNVFSLVLGYVRDVGTFSGGTIGLGAAGMINVIPSTLEQAYGTRTPSGFSIFVRFRPNRMQMPANGGRMDMRPGMQMDSASTVRQSQPSMGAMPGMRPGNPPRTSADSTAAANVRERAPRDTSMAAMKMAPAAARADTTHADSAAHHPMAAMPGMTDSSSMNQGAMKSMMELEQRMLADPVIRRRVLADTAMRRLIMSTLNQMPAERRAMIESMLRSERAQHTTKPSATTLKKRSTGKPAPKPAKQPSDTAKRAPMKGMKMPGMKMPDTKPPSAP